jgi:hypothetical protein
MLYLAEYSINLIEVASYRDCLLTEHLHELV